MDPQCQDTKRTEKPTAAETAARAQLLLARDTLADAQTAVTAALVPVATLEAERHPEAPRLVSAVAEARANLANAQRSVEVLLEYGLNGTGAYAVMNQVAVGMGAAMGGYTKDRGPRRG